LIKGEQMDALISTLVDRTGNTAGTFVVVSTDNATNVCTTAQVTAAKAKYWNVKSINAQGEFIDFAGSDATSVAPISADENATVIAIYNLNGQKLSHPQPGLNILKLSNGTVKKFFLKE
jgi:hypothetical protein